LNLIWRANNLSDKIKVNLFNALIVSLLLYNATTWTVNKTLSSKLLDGAYNRLFRYALNIRWDPITEKTISNAAMYQKFKTQPISLTLLQRRLSFSGHCYRSFNTAPQPISDLLFWQPSHFGPKKSGRRSNYCKLLCSDTNLDIIDLQNEMLNQKSWIKFINGYGKKFSKYRDELNYEDWKMYVSSYYKQK
jgi:hypothetical protein